MCYLFVRSNVTQQLCHWISIDYQTYDIRKAADVRSGFSFVRYELHANFWGGVGCCIMAESIYHQVALQKGTKRVSKREKKQQEDIYQKKRKEILAGERIPLLNRRKERIMNPWGHRANVAFCTFFFVYQVCSQTYLILCCKNFQKKFILKKKICGL